MLQLALVQPGPPRPVLGADPGSPSWPFGPNPPAPLDLATAPNAVAGSPAKAIAGGRACGVRLPFKHRGAMQTAFGGALGAQFEIDAA